jgi:hypothetical protein
MSTILQTPKMKNARLIDIRVQALLLAAAVIAMLAVIFANVAVSSEAGSMDVNAFQLYRQDEWASVPFTPAQAYQIFRRGEVASPASSAEAYQIFRQGEWASARIPVTAGNLSAYHLSERTLMDTQAGLAAYQLSERSLLDPQADMAIYQLSERTRHPVQFSPYQRSEWFGE